jgi:hypothetical protein
VTRGKKLVVVIGQMKALTMAVKRKSLVLVRSLLGRDGVPVTVKECLEVVNDLMTETVHAFNEGEIN